MDEYYNILTHKLPNTITVGDQKYIIDTRACRALDALCILGRDIPHDIQILGVSKALLKTDVEGNIPFSPGIIDALMDYLEGAPTLSGAIHKPQSIPVFDYLQDSKAILAAFYQAYGLGIEEIKNMHWWVFQALLVNLPSDTRLSETISIRSMQPDPKSTAESKNRIAKAKQSVALKDTRSQQKKSEDGKKAVASGFAGL